MKVEILVNLKVSAREIISTGTTFDDSVEKFPSWLVDEIKAKSKHIKIHAAPIKPKEPAPEPESISEPKAKAKVEVAPPKQKAVAAPKKEKPAVKKRGRPTRRK